MTKIIQDAIYTRIDDTFFQNREIQQASKTASVHATLITADTRIETIMADGHKETIKDAKAGEILLRNPSGEEYAIGAAKFVERYGEFKGDGDYVPTGAPIKFAFTEVPVVLTASWGEDMHIKAGGAIVYEGEGKIYGIQPEAFTQTYTVITPEPENDDVSVKNDI